MTRRRVYAAPHRSPRRSSAARVARAPAAVRAGRAAFSPAWLRHRLAELAPRGAIPDLCVAFSGGIDSTALLVALAVLPELRGRVRAVHVDHRLQPASREWAAHCAAVAAQVDVPFRRCVARIAVGAGESLEAVAREARYALLARELRAGEWLVTAHHQDDQAESLLLQLLRGAGVAGLAAMPELRPFAAGALVRPLLPVPRAALARWIEERGIACLDDPSNADLRFDRNYLRQRVFPALRERWPAAAAAISRSSRHVAEAKQLLDTLALADAGRAADGSGLAVPALRALPVARRRNAIRWWLAQAGVAVPDTRRLREIVGPLLEAREDANPMVEWPGAAVTRELGRLVVRVAAPQDAGRERGRTAHRDRSRPDAAQAWRWRLGRPIAAGGGTLCVRRDPHGPLDLDALPRELRIGVRQGGERIRPRRGGPSRPLKQLLQEARVAPRERAGLPLVFAGERLVAVGALWLDESVQASATTSRRGRLIWSVESPARAPVARARKTDSGADSN